MPLHAVVLICSLARSDYRHCDVNNAVDVMKTPVSEVMPTTCWLHGQAFVAQMQFGRDLRPDERVKVICPRPAEMTEFLRGRAAR